MLEPDKTGLHKNGGSNMTMILIVLIVVLAAAIGTALFLFKDKIF